jgi:hypothetical protein
MGLKSKTAKNLAKKLTLCPECLLQIQHNTFLSTTPHILKQGGGSIMLWVCLSSARTREFFRIKTKLSRAKLKQNPTRKPG